MRLPLSAPTIKQTTDEVNSQIADINKIVKKYSKDSMVIGEAPLTKDLQDVTDIDLVNVNYVSVLCDIPYNSHYL